MINNNVNNLIQNNSPDGGFLQSEEWRKFQKAVDKNTFIISNDNFHANIIEHKLPIAGKYFYVPRGPIMCHPEISSGSQEMLKQVQHDNMEKLINLAKKENAGWIRIEPATDEILKGIKNNIDYKIIKSPHDMQPKEILVMDITKSEEQLLSEMKSKTRYNIKLAEKKGIKVECIKYNVSGIKYVDEFLRLTKIMGKRQKISVHPESYYQKMIEIIPENILKLYVAEYDNKIIAANLVVFYGNTCTYLHGASDDSYRNIMAPHLLQWRQIQDAKSARCGKYDFGGIKSHSTQHIIRNINNSWGGITRFKTGFAPNIKTVEFPGSYDIVISPVKYKLYRSIQKVKSLIS